MPTIEEEKPAKPRARGRKADQRNAKSGRPQAELRTEADPVSALAIESEAAATESAPVEAVPAEPVSVEAAPVEVVSAPVEAVAVEPAQMVAVEKAQEAALSGEVLPPQVLRPASQVDGFADGFQAVAQACDEYTKKSWLNGRFLVERLIAARSFDEAFEIQGEFAKQAYANFLAHSQKVCVLYGEWAQQWFRPLEKFAAQWPRS